MLLRIDSSSQQSITMRIFHSTAVLAVAFLLTAPVGHGQNNTEQTNETRAQLKRNQKANKAQARADKKERKALNTHEQKEADKAQNSADRKAADAAAHQ